jgi:hypothetical protein
VKKKPAIFVAGFFRFIVVDFNLHPLRIAEEEQEEIRAAEPPGPG